MWIPLRVRKGDYCAWEKAENEKVRESELKVTF